MRKNAPLGRRYTNCFEFGKFRIVILIGCLTPSRQTLCWCPQMGHGHFETLKFMINPLSHLPLIYRRYQ